MSKWVGHVKDTEDRWKLEDIAFNELPEYPSWLVRATDGSLHYLPRTKYRPCEPPTPPERWEDITEQCEAGYRTFTGPSAVWNVSLKMPDKNEGYTFRLRKVQLETRHTCGKTLANIVWAFVVEKKVTS